MYGRFKVLRSQQTVAGGNSGRVAYTSTQRSLPGGVSNRNIVILSEGGRAGGKWIGVRRFVARTSLGCGSCRHGAACAADAAAAATTRHSAVDAAAAAAAAATVMSSHRLETPAVLSPSISVRSWIDASYDAVGRLDSTSYEERAHPAVRENAPQDSLRAWHWLVFSIDVSAIERQWSREAAFVHA